MGATLPSSQTRYRVSAPSSHSIPVIRCLGTYVNDAEIRLYQCENGLDSLKSLSPLFAKLWNDGSGALGPEYQSMLQKSKTSTFQIVYSQFWHGQHKLTFDQLFSSKDEPQRAYLQPLISPPEWNEILSKLSTSTPHKTSTIMICGPKSSGKSTFGRLLVNRILSSVAPDVESSNVTKVTGVAVLDLDPGQPEYSPPGQLSLIRVQELNFGQPFSHPVPDDKSMFIRSHAIGAISPSLDPSLYMACALDLFAHYRNLLQSFPGCPLIINTPGWVLGTGLEILLDLIARAGPTEVIYMSTEGPLDVVQSLREEAKLIPVITLPSQASEYTTRTAAHLRTMQNMSYFHLDPNTKQEPIWNGQPLTSIPPWEIRYSGENAGILGVLCYGEQPPASLLAETINGSLVAVVVVDDMAAIPGWAFGGEDTINGDGGLEITNPKLAERDPEIRVFGEDSLHPGHLERPIIIRTPIEDLPYFNPANTISLDPKYSHSIGLALVRGIDVTRRRIQVLTPIPSELIEEINEAGKSIVFVSGKLDTPGWAYTEELNRKTALSKASRDQEIMDLDEEGDGGGDDVGGAIDGTDGTKNQRSRKDGFKTAPWIEKLEGSQGRGIGSRVWRVRRDLGRGADGGD
jgi:polynucleotide 5'-hydroxyl-kinase GRC3/NOL9